MAQNFFYDLSRIYLKIIAKFSLFNEPVDVFSTITQAKQILICLPDKIEDFGIARNFTTLFRVNFSHSKVTFLLKQNYVNLLNKIDRESCGILSLSQENITRFGLPSRQVLVAIKKVDFDLAIDLNNEFCITSTYTCLVSGAHLRICLGNKNRDPFFNFQIRTNPEDSIESKYRTFLKYLTINIKSDEKNPIYHQA